MIQPGKYSAREAMESQAPFPFSLMIFLGLVTYLPPKYYCPFGGPSHPPEPCSACYPVQSPN